MDRKTWFGRKKSSEKTYDASDKVKNISFQRNEEDKAELERDLKILNDKLSSVFSECSTKDELVKKHAKMTQDAIAGWEKAESEAISLKRELDEAIQQRAASEERLANLDAALKECMRQLRYVRKEQEKNIHDVAMKTSREFEKSQIVLEDRLAETVSRLSRMGIENSHLSKALVLKEKTIRDLNQQLAEMEADFNSLILRLESKDKDNNSLKYELRVLEKEFEIRNEEREFHRRTADASHKDHLESVKKFVKLESECQSLRLLVQKRLPGPATLAKMKNEVEILGKDSFDRKRRQLSPMGIVDLNFPGTPEKRISILNEKLSFLEEENRALKEALENSPNRLSPIDLPQDDSPKGQSITEPVRRHELSLTSMLDISSDDKVSCSESCSSALILEPLHTRNEKIKAASSCKTTISSDMDLMDDFAEMEKLAIASVDNKAKAVPSSLETMVQKESTVSEFSVPGYLQEIVKMVLEQSHVTERNPEKVLEDIRVALAVDFSSGVTCTEMASTEKINEQGMADLSESLHKLIELIEGISFPSTDYDNLEASRKEGGVFSETPTGYVARVFQWKISELSAILNQFVQTCYELSNGVSHPGKFVLELTNALGWIMNHCFSLQDVSTMRDSIKKHFDWDETRSEIEVEIGMIDKFSELDNSLVHKDKWSCFSMATSNQDNIQAENFPSKLTEGNINPQEEWLDTKSANVDLEVRHQSSTTDSLMIELGESGKSIFTLRNELETLKRSKGVNDNQTKNRVELNEACPIVPSVETKLENKNKGIEELEATPLELKPQLNRYQNRTEMKQTSDGNIIHKERRLQTDLEKTSASEKVSECNVSYATTNMAGRAQVPANDMTMSCRSSLLGQMQAEDNPATGKNQKAHKPIEAISNMTSTSGCNKPIKTLEQILDLNGPAKYQEEKTAVGSLGIVVPSKRSGGGSLWRKLPWRKKKVNN